ncbi:Rrf2 family protein [Filimonas zeae]|uniref:Rrf2 family transcriptional regulator n=1 Tax=Filimonas zeae TaxID=1737353 RepID=A0A917MVD3_9BACT|nr:Rrf2 family transcriptional regulator [Filimonas zeae]MDR6338820.1 Rrf2 family protein [Filimonas zeae]GGH66443.1 Rrf2 family transcriptional regulator [Filimonas zeae]
MNNGRFSISVHILTLLATSQGELLSSEWIAGSININPVLVRKELSNLREHGLVISKEGKNGGAQLAKPARDILLSEVYEAVKQSPVLGVAKNTPNPDCLVGRQINQHLDDLYEEVDRALLAKLGQTTLEAFCKKFV